MRHMACTWGKRKYTQRFGMETKGKITFRRPMRREKDNIKMDLREIGWIEWTEFMWTSRGTRGRLL